MTKKEKDSKGGYIMRNIFLAMMALGFLVGCENDADSRADDCLEGETQEQCVERNLPEMTSGDTD